MTRWHGQVDLDDPKFATGGSKLLLAAGGGGLGVLAALAGWPFIVAHASCFLTSCVHGIFFGLALGLAFVVFGLAGYWRVIALAAVSSVIMGVGFFTGSVGLNVMDRLGDHNSFGIFIGAAFGGFAWALLQTGAIALLSRVRPPLWLWVALALASATVVGLQLPLFFFNSRDTSFWEFLLVATLLASYSAILFFALPAMRRKGRR